MKATLPTNARRENASTRGADASGGPRPGGDVTVDEMSDASFPASDPPATWTWEVRRAGADADDSDEVTAGVRAMLDFPRGPRSAPPEGR
jgi:hypothetical protein